MPARVLRIKSELPDEWCEAQVDQYLDETHFDFVLPREPINVLKPDGSPLLIYRPGAIPIEICEGARPAFRKIGARYSNKRRWFSGIFGNFTRPVCRRATITERDLNAYTSLLPFVRTCDEVFRSEIPARYAPQRQRAVGVGKWAISDTAFTTGTANLWDEGHEAMTPVHVDDGDLPEGFGVISVLSAGEYVGGQLIFLKYGVAVDLRTTDVLLADVHEFHGNAPIRQRSEGWERIAVILYFLTDIEGCPRSESAAN